MFERVVRSKIVNYIEVNNLITPNQHGFRKGRSCLTQLIHHIDEIFSILETSNNADVIYLDFAKAFDKVDHALLLKKISQMGIHDKVLKWIEAFLTNRFQKVVINGESSSGAKVISGVPQGTVLGPLLFIIFINDIENVIKYSNIKIFADDSKLCKSVKWDKDQYELQLDLNAVIKWAHENNMELNEDKFQLLKHGNVSEMKDLPYQLPSGKSLHPSPTVKDLGITVNEDLEWRIHIHNIVKDAKMYSGWILRTFKSRKRSVLMTLYSSLVRSRLEYCCPLWSPYIKKDISNLESVQKHFTSRIAGMQNLNYWERLKDLDLYSMQRRRERCIIIHTWKIFSGLTPNDIGLKFYYHPRLGPRCERPKLLSNQVHLNTLKHNSFSSVGTALLNIIPKEIKAKDNLEQFKRSLDRYLKVFPDTPPVPGGYVSQNGNSLLEWASSNILLPGRATLMDLA